MNTITTYEAKRMMKLWFFIGVLLFLGVASVQSQTMQPMAPQHRPAAENLESRMDLILEFNSIVGEYLDNLFTNQKPDLAMLEWCEKAELRALGYSKIQQSYGELYISIKSCIRGDERKARIALQKAVWLMAGERYEVLAATR